MIKIGIIDDEASARKIITKFLERCCENYEIVFEATNFKETTEKTLEFQPDILFLDIHLTNSSGIEAALFLKNKSNTKIIFTTADNEYVLKAFKLNIFDYLLKPLNLEEFSDSIKRVIEEIEIEKSQKKLNASTTISQSLIGNQMVNNDAISFIKAEGSYCEIQLKNGKILTLSKPLKHIEVKIEKSSLFLKTHKSFIVNTDNVNSLDRSKKELILKDGKKIPISRRCLKMVFDFFQPRINN